MKNMWQKRVLVPFWVIQLLVLLLVLGLAAYVEISFENLDNVYLAHAVDIGAVILICFSGISIIFDTVEIFLFARDRLLPLVVLIFSCIRTVFWLVFFASAISSVANGNGLLAIIAAIILFLTALGQLIYSSIIYHRYRKGHFRHGAYAPAVGGARADSPLPGGSYTAYEPGPEPRRDPFRDPSPTPSGSAMHSQVTHPAFRQNGASNEYYDGQQSFELSASTPRYGA